MYQDPQQNVPTSGRESTVNRAMNESPGLPSPEGRFGSGSPFVPTAAPPGVGPVVFASPSNALPASSWMRSNTVKVYRSSGSGWARSSLMSAQALSPAFGCTETLYGGLVGGFVAGGKDAQLANDRKVAPTISMSPH